MSGRGVHALAAVALVVAAVVGARGEEPGALLRRADAFRAPAGSFEMRVSITDFEGGQPLRTTVARVRDDGKDATLIALLEPARDLGKTLLGRGTDLWIYLPDVGKPVRVPFTQRLTGQISNGDIARLRFAQDYGVTSVADEELDGTAARRLVLRAIRPEATYGGITVWVAAADGRPLKAEYRAVSDQLLKVGRFGDYVDEGGHPRCTSLTLTDAVRTDRYSVMRFEKIVQKSFPPSIFTKESMGRID